MWAWGSRAMRCAWMPEGTATGRRHVTVPVGPSMLVARTGSGTPLPPCYVRTESGTGRCEIRYLP